jgi:hypothetical protein
LVPSARRTRAWRSSQGSLRYRGRRDARLPDTRLQQALSRLAASHVGSDASRHRVDRCRMVHPILAYAKPRWRSPRLYLRAAIWQGQKLDECRLLRSWPCSTSITSANTKCRVPLRWRIFGRWWCRRQVLSSAAMNPVDKAKTDRYCRFALHCKEWDLLSSLEQKRELLIAGRHISLAPNFTTIVNFRGSGDIAIHHHSTPLLLNTSAPGNTEE